MLGISAPVCICHAVMATKTYLIWRRASNYTDSRDTTCSSDVVSDYTRTSTVNHSTEVPIYVDDSVPSLASSDARVAEWRTGFDSHDHAIVDRLDLPRIFTGPSRRLMGNSSTTTRPTLARILNDLQ